MFIYFIIYVNQQWDSFSQLTSRSEDNINILLSVESYYLKHIIYHMSVMSFLPGSPGSPFLRSFYSIMWISKYKVMTSKI